jgi:hypothetical protein
MEVAMHEVRLVKWGGGAFMLGSLLFLVNKLDEMSRLFFSYLMADVISGQDTFLVVVGQVAYIIGYVAFWRLYAARAGRAGRNALRLFCGGGIILAIGHVTFMPWLPVDLFLLVFVGLTLMVAGLIWFGIVNLRHSILARWQWLPLVTGLMGFIGFFLLNGEETTAVFLLFRTLFALGLLGLGLTMWLEKSAHLQVAA